MTAAPSTEVPADRKPLWARCVPCGHCFPVVYMPMEAMRCSEVIQRRSVCPLCAADGADIVIAKQADGVLHEPLSDGAAS